MSLFDDDTRHFLLDDENQFALKVGAEIVVKEVAIVHDVRESADNDSNVTGALVDEWE